MCLLYNRFSDLSSLGLCGNFNDIQSDDFTTMYGSCEGTSVGFGNSWRTKASCPEVKNVFENPCSLSVENGMFFIYSIIRSITYAYPVCLMLMYIIGTPHFTCSYHLKDNMDLSSLCFFLFF